MDSLFNFFYGPLDKKYCNVFLLLSFFSLFSIFSVIVLFLLTVFSSKKMGSIFYLQLVWLLLLSSLGYISYRLLYNLCLNKQ